MFLRFPAPLGSEQTRPREGASPRSPLAELGTAPVCAGDREGLLCGWDVAPQRDRGRSNGARESQLCSGGVITKIFSKVHFDITMYYYRGALYNNDT